MKQYLRLNNEAKKNCILKIQKNWILKNLNKSQEDW